MSKLQSDVKKKYWERIDPKVRSNIMSEVSKARHYKMSKEEKTRMGKEMASKRWAKKNIPIM